MLSDFEKNIRNDLDNYESAIDAEAVWSDLQPLKKKKKKFLFWWWGTALLFLLIVGIFISSIFFKNDMDGVIQSNDALLAQNQSSNSIKRTAEQISIDEAIQTISRVESENSINANDKNEINTTLLNKETGIDQTSKNTSKITAQVIRKNQAIIFSNQNHEEEIKESINPFESHIAAFSQPILNKTDYSKGMNFQRKPLSFSRLKGLVLGIEYANPKLEITLEKTFKKLKDRLTKSEDSQNENYFLETYFIPEYSSKTYSSLSNPTYAEARDSTETYVFSSTTGLSIGRNISKHFYIASGLELTRSVDRFEYQDTFYNSIDIDKFKRNSSGGLDTLFGDNDFVQRRIINKKIYDKYHLVNIPIIIGANINFKKISINIQSGISINALFTQKGQILNADSFVENLDNLNESLYYNSTVGISYFGDVLFSIPLQENLSFNFGPHINIGTRSWTNEEASSINKIYKSYGLRTSLRYGF